MMNRTTLSAAALLLFTLAACDNDPGKGKTAAKAAEPVATTQSASTQGATKYAFSQADSKLTWVGAKVTRKHDGGFNSFSGTISSPDGKPESSSVTVDIDLASLFTDDAKLAGHLKAPDFFDVAKFQKAKFTSTSVKAGGENGASHTITGNLDLHGVTKSISFPATVRMGADAVEADAEFTINRKDFGITYPGMADDLIKDQVSIKLSIRSKKNAS